MNVLFISTDGMAINLCRILKKEGHNVKLYIEKDWSKDNFDNIVEKTKNWKNDLKWVGKEGLIIFDDIGWGKEQDKLRKEGYNVFGGSEIADKIEMDREFGQKIFKKYGLNTVPLKDFDDMEDSIHFIQKNPNKWVVKFNNHESKFLTYIGSRADGKDVISLLKNYLSNKYINKEGVTLQERVEGVEIGVGRYFNGHDWIGPIELNVEHTKMFPGDLGPITSEMGTVAWYDNDENNKLFVEVLDKVKPFLQEIKFKGDFEIDCIVNEKGAFVLEATARLGTPIIHIHSELHLSPWGEFLMAIANGKKYDLKYKRGFAVVNLLATPPFPYINPNTKNHLYGVNIYFDESITEEDKKHIYLEGVSERTNGEKGQLYVTDTEGYIMYTAHVDDTIEEARKKSLDIAKKIILPKVFYRNDIGKKLEKDMEKLKKWGYVK